MSRLPGWSNVRAVEPEKLQARRRFLQFAGGASLALLAHPLSAADPDVPYDRVEEDWTLVIGEPEPEAHAPQLLNVISPTGDLAGKYGILELNHSTQPEYFEGGLQMQLWSGDECREHATTADSSLLMTTGETISYTLVMAVGYGQLRFRVKNGTSTTWGSFGGSDLLVTSSTSLNNLTGYSPTISASKSRVGFAGHRVEKFALKQVRYYVDNTVVKVDETYRQVHPALE
ncbi:hypothetical protein GC163_12840 [bacterium]|nr:hypothetical protein [bacterium]